MNFPHASIRLENHPVLTRPYGPRLLTADRAASHRYHTSLHTHNKREKEAEQCCTASKGRQDMSSVNKWW